VDGGAGDELQWPFVGQAHEAEDEVYDLKSGERLDGAIEVLGEEVPEDLGPEEAFNRGTDLVDGSGEDDEARPVVLDELSHGDEGCGVEREDN